MQTASEPPFCSVLKPSIQSHFADPSIIHHNGMLYAFATNNMETGLEALNVQLATSSDNKTFVLQAYETLPNLPPWSTSRHVWAPDVSKLDDGRFIMYYSINVVSSPRHHCIGAALADEIIGPYIPQDSTLICPDPNAQGGAIDASAFIDFSTGKRYITYKIDGNSLGHGGSCSNTVVPLRNTPLMLQEVEHDGITLIGEPVQLLDRDASDGPLIEAPSLVQSREGIYFLFYSSHCFSTLAYTVKYATSTTLTGPYLRASQTFLATSSDTINLVGPGGLHILPSIDSGDHQIVFHGHMTLNNSRQYRSRLAQTATAGNKLPLVRGMYIATARLHGHEASLVVTENYQDCQSSATVAINSDVDNY